MANERRYNQETEQWEDVDSSGNFEDRKYDAAQTEEIAFLNGNRNTPALLLGDDPSNETNETDNVLVVPLGTAVSVPRNTVGKLEGTSEDGTVLTEDTRTEDAEPERY
jgi:hypothetical protein